MAWTARDEDDKKEYFDPPEALERKTTELASWIRASRHMIVFTVSCSTVDLANSFIVLVALFTGRWN